MRPCLHPSCPVLVERGRCATHQAQARQVESRYTKGNYGRPWRRRRAEFLQDSYPWFCAIQGSACTVGNRQMEEHEVEVDHIVPHRGDTALRDDPANFQITCKACHSQKTAREVEWNLSAR